MSMTRLLSSGTIALVALLGAPCVTAETLPDTLNLAQHAKLALSGLNGTTDERGEFMFKCSIAPPSLTHDAYSFSACGPKYIESMAMASLMTGIGLDESGSRKAIDYLMSCLGDDGLFYCKIGPERPWDTASPEDWANMYGQGRMLRAMLAVHQLEGGDVWVQRMRHLVRTLDRIVIRKTDPENGETYAYFPTTPGYGDIFSYPKSGWKTTDLLTEADQSEIGVSIADVPDHSFGIPLYLGGMVEGLTRYGTTHDDPAALKLARDIVRFVMKKESSWIPDGHAQGVIPEQNGQFYGHFHGHTLCLRGILEYGIATNDARLKEFARAGYEFARTLGIPRIGWFQEYTGKHSHETCGLVNMTALAIKLSRAGMGDYWEDVDGYVRNHLTAAQFVDMQAFLDANEGNELTDEQQEILRRIVGTFGGWGTPEFVDDSRVMNCCTANGTQGLYYVWDSIVDQQDDLARINLLLNRRSASVDVVSWLPYTGKVELHNKQPQRLAVRIPNWVDKGAVNVAISGDAPSGELTWIGNYVWLGKVAAGRTVTISFPVVETTETYSIDSYEFRGTKYLGRHKYAIKFRGNTVVKLDPSPKDGYATYARRQYGEAAPMIKVDNYVPTKRIDW